LLEDGDVPVTAWALLHYLAEAGGDREGVSTTYDDLARLLRVHERTVRRSLDRLRELELVCFEVGQGRRQPFRIALGERARVSSTAPPTSDTASDTNPPSNVRGGVRGNLGHDAHQEQPESRSASGDAAHATSDASCAGTENEKRRERPAGGALTRAHEGAPGHDPPALAPVLAWLDELRHPVRNPAERETLANACREAGHGVMQELEQVVADPTVRSPRRVLLDRIAKGDHHRPTLPDAYACPGCGEQFPSTRDRKEHATGCEGAVATALEPAELERAQRFARGPGRELESEDAFRLEAVNKGLALGPAVAEWRRLRGVQGAGS
jgi:hypothetical protein